MLQRRICCAVASVDAAKLLVMAIVSTNLITTIFVQQLSDSLRPVV